MRLWVCGRGLVCGVFWGFLGLLLCWGFASFLIKVLVGRRWWWCSLSVLSLVGFTKKVRFTLQCSL